MKKVLTLMVIAALTMIVNAQSPQKMSYQCVVRNTSGALVTSHAVGMKISILKGTSTGTVVFSETYSPNPQTNANGLVTVEIGSGTATVGTFAGIDWSEGPYFLKTETDPAGGTNYTISGTSQLLSVPYALYAKTASNGFSGAWADLTGKPAFATVATSGSYNDLLNRPTLFSGSYNDLTNRPVLFDGTWSSLTGKPTTLSGYGITDADGSITNEIQLLSLNGSLLTLSNGGGTVTLPSSGGGDNWGTQAVVTNTTLTGAGTTASPLAVANTVITPTWANVQSKPAGFADGIDNVDDADNSITNEIQTLSINSSNLTLSQGGGTVAIPGDNWGTQNVAVNTVYFTGNGTSASPLTLSSMGASTGQVLKYTGTTWDNAPDDNGPWSDTSDGISYSGTKRVGIGINKPTQQLTVADGSTACYVNIQNTSTGYSAIDGLLLGIEGTNAYLTTNEIGKLYLGTNSVIRLSIAADGDVGIGTTSPVYKLDVAGIANLNKGIASGQAILCNGSEALWYDGTYFSWGFGGTWNYFKDAVGIDCQPGDGHMLAVNGVASKPGGGTWAAFSDIRLKDIHGQYTRGLSDILQLQPVIFNYKNGNELNLPSNTEYVGFIAQDVQKVFPETINETSGGYLEFDMHPVNVAVINAIKELNQEIEGTRLENQLLKSELQALKEKLTQLETLLK